MYSARIPQKGLQTELCFSCKVVAVSIEVVKAR